MDTFISLRIRNKAETALLLEAISELSLDYKFELKENHDAHSPQVARANRKVRQLRDLTNRINEARAARGQRG